MHTQPTKHPRSRGAATFCASALAFAVTGVTTADGPDFDSAEKFPAEAEVIYVEVGNLDTPGGANTVDVVAVLPNLAAVQIFLNAGGDWDGLDPVLPPIPVGLQPMGVTAGTITTGDQHLDLVVANSGDDTVSILINQGDGNATFMERMPRLMVGAQPTAVAVAEFNGDAHLDLAVANTGDNTVSFYWGVGDGSFTVGPVEATEGVAPVRVQPHILDNDKCVDVMGLNAQSSLGPGAGGGPGNVFVLNNLGNGTFEPAKTFPVGMNPKDLAVGNLDPDSNTRPDIVVVNADDATITVLSNRGGGNFVTALVIGGIGSDPSAIEAADLDNDLDLDLAIAALDGGTRVVQVLENLYAGGTDPSFGPAVTFTVGGIADANYVTSADFNADGALDLVTGNFDEGEQSDGSVSVLLNTAVGACCEAGGGCTEDTSRDDCEAGTGFFLGIGTDCADCPVRGADGWALVAPFRWVGDGNLALGAFDDCASGPFFGGSDDESFVITLPWPQRWTFETCDSDIDVLMAMGDLGQCSANRRVSFDSVYCPGFIAAYFQDNLTPDTTVVNVGVEDEIGGGGEYELVVSAQCRRLAPSPEATPEAEPCGADVNGGCDSLDEGAVQAIACGETVRGSTWFDGASRDTDWYALTVTADTEVRVVGRSVFAGHWFGYVVGSDAQDCDEVTGFSVRRTRDCLDIPRRALHTFTLAHTDADGGDPDTTVWWLFAAPDPGGPIQLCDEGYVPGAEDPGPALPPDVRGQNGYTLAVTCTVACECTGDVDDDCDVDFQDLLVVLTDFGCTGEACPGDADGNGETDFSDIIVVLANWGDC